MAGLAREALSERTLVALVPHMDAGDRRAWTRNQDERPLSDLGQRQADAIAAALIKAYEVDALFASTALRARQTLEPLAERLGLAVQIEPLLCEKQLGESTVDLGERGIRALLALSKVVDEGVVVAASHGDIIPATVGALDSTLRRVPGGPDSAQLWRSRWYEITLDGRDVSVTLREAATFPL